MNPPSRVFLDTNVFIIGAAYEDGAEAKILRWLGYGEENASSVEVVVSQDLFNKFCESVNGLRIKTGALKSLDIYRMISTWSTCW